MRTGRRIGSAAAVLAMAMSIVFVVSTAPALAATSSDTAATATGARKAPKGPRPVTRVLRAVESGEAQWVRVRWKTDRRICDVKVVVWGDDVEINYPGDREFTSLSRGDSLGRGKTDYAAFRVEADYDRSSWALLEATISYTDCGRDAPTRSRDTTLMLPVRS